MAAWFIELHHPHISGEDPVRLGPYASVEIAETIANGIEGGAFPLPAPLAEVRAEVKLIAANGVSYALQLLADRVQVNLTERNG